ncbi:MAG: CRISPR-associated endonuclease Cas2 [Candidatus Kerfeldbacteria bacterium]|nr:CRISPR-associated endonuclease Cas2 [Candidatus Kerfeldbacteria bacterium]
MINKKPKTKLVLGALVEVLTRAGEAAIEIGSFFAALQSGYGGAYRRGGSAYVAELKRSLHDKDVRQALYDLKRKQYVIARRIGSRLELALTSKGVAVTVSQRLLQAKEHSKGICTVVIFDIPRSENAARRRFRWFLRQGGFTKLQQSVWVSRRIVRKPLMDLVRKLKLQSWVNVFDAGNFLNYPRFK